MNPWLALFSAADAPSRLMIGLMSGTSGDGTDAVLVRIMAGEPGTLMELIASVSCPFSPTLRDTILAISKGEGDAEAISRLSVELAEEYALAVDALCTQAGITDRRSIAAIGCHGQTISHTPHGLHPATLQIGDAATLAYRTGISVISNFRAADVAAGGQGAPLVPFVDWKLLTHPTRSRAVQNIGGIANVTYLPAQATAEQVIGFDTGPGNMLIDLAAEWATEGAMTFDRDGLLAAQGEVQPALLAYLFQHPFLARTPPRSAGREEFGNAYWNMLLQLPPAVRSLTPRHIVATVTAFTAYTIADAYVRFLPELPEEVIVSGGGAKNPVLMQYITEKLVPIPVLTSDALGINPHMREAIAFALLADETLQGKPANLPGVTGAARPVVLGSITLPG